MTSAPHLLGPKDQRWFMDLEDVPDHPLHDAIIALLMLILQHRYRGQDALVARNLGCRWEPSDRRVGVDPDIVLIAPAPPDDLSTLQIWLPDHPPPKLAVEVVSETNAAKDYQEGPLRMARLGAEELWIFDPELHGPHEQGGPVVMQIWRRVGDRMERIHAGDAPAYSPALGAWTVLRHTEDGRPRLRVAEDDAGALLWPTEAEAAAAQAQKEAERADDAAARAEEAEARAEAAASEIQRLRALLDGA